MRRDREKYTRVVEGRRLLWWTDRLWTLAAGLPVVSVEINAIPEFDQDCWFGEKYTPSVRAVAEHARRIAAADLSYPIIFSAEGWLMNGGHRIAKAWLEGRSQIDAVRFAVDPEPDEILPVDAASHA